MSISSGFHSVSLPSSVPSCPSPDWIPEVEPGVSIRPEQGSEQPLSPQPINGRPTFLQFFDSRMPSRMGAVPLGPPPIPPYHSCPKYVQRHQAPRVPLDPVEEDVRSLTVDSSESLRDLLLESEHVPVYTLPRALPADISVAQAAVKKIDPLTRTNILEWDTQIMTPITQLQLNGHICKEPLPGTRRTIYNTPVVQPPIPDVDASVTEKEEYDNWRRNDHTVFSLLISRISSSCRSSLPGPITDDRITTAREMYDTIHRNWGMSNDLGAMGMEDKLMTTKALKLMDVEKYVDNYRRTVESLEKVIRIDWPRYLRHFANGLPNSHTFNENFNAIMRAAKDSSCSKSTFEILAADVMTTVANESHRSQRTTQPGQVGDQQQRPRCEGCGGIGRTRGNCRNCIKKAAPGTPATTPASNTQNNKSRPTVAAVATQQIKEIDAYPVCAVESVVAALAGDDDIHPLRRLREDSPEVYQDLKQTFSTVLDSACTKHIITNLD
ncbi:hypothetical protein PQX77_018790 [Marasmius sp. AFHP31]|nr:hypothetical protein PQX77_018790 [Marasmius sp. AFHP31]